ncbi:MAG: hypothetical protein OHK0029_20430 [Armatimonadaceae bacterium]
MRKNPESGAAEPAKAARPALSRPGIMIRPSKMTCIVLGALMAAVLAGGAGLYFWQSSEIAKVAALVEQKRGEVAEGEKIARRLADLEAEYQTMQNQLRFLETSVSAKEYTPTMLKQMEQLANQVNLKVGGVRPKWIPAPEPPKDEKAKKEYKPEPYDKLAVDMEITGTYWNIARFLYRMTEFPKIMAVNSLSINPRNTEGYDPNLSAKINLTGFVFPNPEDAVNAENGAPAGASSTQAANARRTVASSTSGTGGGS